jgi:hypothetical protein
MIKAILIAGVLAATWTWLGSVYAITSHSAETTAGTARPSAKGNRLDIKPPGNPCSQQVWPYYSGSCLKNRRPADKAKETRLVFVLRLSTANPSVAFMN